MKDKTLVARYITKYALTSGIFACRGEIVLGTYFSSDENGMHLFIRLGECPETLAEAQAIAEGMRLKKIESLKRQLAKLEKMKIKTRELATERDGGS